VSSPKQTRKINRITNHTAMKLNNQLTILRIIRNKGPITRIRLQKETGLSWGTITSSTKQLIKKKIIREIGSIQTGVGRRPVELDLNTNLNFVVGLRLGSSYIRAVVLDIKGTVVFELKTAVNAQAEKEVLLEQLLDACNEAIINAGIRLDRVAGIGIAAPGALDAHTGMCLYAPHHPRWKNVPLKSIFEEKFGKPCFVDHVNNCSALGQMWFDSETDISNFICVLLGTGISAGIIIDGEVYRGSNCAAGEFGHICINPSGPECACGNRGCLEVYASGPALTRMAQNSVRANSRSAMAVLAQGAEKAISAEIVHQAAKKGDADAVSIFESMGSSLGIGISTLINLFNPERIILCGRVSQASRFFLPSMLKAIDERAWHISSKEVKVSGLANGAVLGAAGIVLQEIYTHDLLLRSGELNQMVEVV